MATILARSRTWKDVKNIINEGPKGADLDQKALAFIHHKLKGNSLRSIGFSANVIAISQVSIKFTSY